MNIWYIKIRIKYYNAIIYVFGILFVFLSGCRYHQTRTSVNDVNLIRIITKIPKLRIQ